MFAASTLALVLAAPPADTCFPRWRLNEGDVVYHRSVSVTEQTMQVAGQTLDQKVETTAVVRFKVTRATRESTVIEMTFLENDVKVQIQGNAGGQPGVKLKGISFTVTLDDRLRVTKFDGYEKYLDAVAEGDEAKRKQARLLTPEAVVRQSFEQMFLLSPDAAVAVGDKWEQSSVQALPPLGTLTVKYGCKLDEVTDGVATVTAKGDATWKAAEGFPDGTLKVTKADLKAESVAAAYRFDLRAGRILDTTSEMRLSGTMTVEIGGNPTEVKLSQKATARTTITTKNPLDD